MIVNETISSVVTDIDVILSRLKNTQAKNEQKEKITLLTPKSKKLFYYVDKLIEQDWENIKKGKSDMRSPSYVYKISPGQFFTLAPVYTSNLPSILVTIDNGPYIEKYLFDRYKPENFIFERLLPTQYGTVTVKTYNSRKEKNIPLESAINIKIQQFFPKILPKKLLREYLFSFSR